MNSQIAADFHPKNFPDDRAKCGVRRISANAQVNIVTLNIPEVYERTPWRQKLGQLLIRLKRIKSLT